MTHFLNFVEKVRHYGLARRGRHPPRLENGNDRSRFFVSADGIKGVTGRIWELSSQNGAPPRRMGKVPAGR